MRRIYLYERKKMNESEWKRQLKALYAMRRTFRKEGGGKNDSNKD